MPGDLTIREAKARRAEDAGYKLGRGVGGTRDLEWCIDGTALSDEVLVGDALLGARTETNPLVTMGTVGAGDQIHGLGRAVFSEVE